MNAYECMHACMQEWFKWCPAWGHTLNVYVEIWMPILLTRKLESIWSDPSKCQRWGQKGTPFIVLHVKASLGFFVSRPHHDHMITSNPAATERKLILRSVNLRDLAGNAAPLSLSINCMYILEVQSTIISAAGPVPTAATGGTSRTGMVSIHSRSALRLKQLAGGHCWWWTMAIKRLSVLAGVGGDSPLRTKPRPKGSANRLWNKLLCRNHEQVISQIKG